MMAKLPPRTHVLLALEANKGMTSGVGILGTRTTLSACTHIVGVAEDVSTAETLLEPLNQPGKILG
jgi:hypothetical protein